MTPTSAQKQQKVDPRSTLGSFSKGSLVSKEVASEVREKKLLRKKQARKTGTCSDVDLLPTAHRLLEEILPQSKDCLKSMSDANSTALSSASFSSAVLPGSSLQRKKEMKPKQKLCRSEFPHSSTSLAALVPTLEKDYHSLVSQTQKNNTTNAFFSGSSSNINGIRKGKEGKFSSFEGKSGSCSKPLETVHNPCDVEAPNCIRRVPDKKNGKNVKNTEKRRNWSETEKKNDKMREGDEEDEDDRKASEEVLRRASQFIRHLKPQQQQAFWSLREAAKGAEGRGEKLHTVGKRTESWKKRQRIDADDLSSSCEMHDKKYRRKDLLLHHKKKPDSLGDDSDTNSENGSANSSGTSSSISSEPSWIAESDDSEEEEERKQTCENSNGEKKELNPTTKDGNGGGKLFCSNEGWSSEDTDE